MALLLDGVVGDGPPGRRLLADARGRSPGVLRGGRPEGARVGNVSSSRACGQQVLWQSFVRLSTENQGTERKESGCQLSAVVWLGVSKEEDYGKEPGIISP